MALEAEFSAILTRRRLFYHQHKCKTITCQYIRILAQTVKAAQKNWYTGWYDLINKNELPSATDVRNNQSSLNLFQRCEYSPYGCPLANGRSCAQSNFQNPWQVWEHATDFVNVTKVILPCCSCKFILGRRSTICSDNGLLCSFTTVVHAPHAGMSGL